MSFMHHLPAWVMLFPLLGAAFCALSPCKRVAWAVALVASVASFGISIVILIHVQAQGPWLYAMGDWTAPLGIVYKIDLLNALVALLINFVASVVLLYSMRHISLDLPDEKQPHFYALFLLCVGGLLGITLTNDAFNLYVFLEISSIATYGLIALGKSRRSLMASFEYLILGTIGAAFYLIGIGLLYAMTGTLNFDDLAQKIPFALDIRPIEAAFVFLTLGIAMKIALFPLHQWITNAYTYAPTPVSAFLASVSSKVGIYVLIRLLFGVFGYHFSFNEIPFAAILGTLAIFALLVGSLVAIFQTNLKRMLAFSSVAQIGYIILGLSFASESGVIAAITHLINDAVAKGCLFLVIGALVWQKSNDSLNALAGSGKQMPYVIPALVIGAFSMIGVPLTGGFVSKWYLVTAAIREDMWFSVTVILISSVMAAVYAWKMVEAAYFREPLQPVVQSRPLPVSMLMGIWTLALACIYLGVDTRFTVSLAEKIAVHFIQGMPW